VLRVPVTFVRAKSYSAEPAPNILLVFRDLSPQSITSLQCLIRTRTLQEPTPEDIDMWSRRLQLDPGDITDFIIFESASSEAVSTGGAFSDFSIEDARDIRKDKVIFR